MQPVHAASMAMQAQITDLQKEIAAIKKEAKRAATWTAIGIAGVALAAAVLK